jgi:hypothetical protein
MSVVDVGQSSSGRWLRVGESDGFQLGRGSLPSNGRTAAAFDEGRATERHRKLWMLKGDRDD